MTKKEYDKQKPVFQALVNAKLAELKLEMDQMPEDEKEIYIEEIEKMKEVKAKLDA